MLSLYSCSDRDRHRPCEDRVRPAQRQHLRRRRQNRVHPGGLHAAGPITEGGRCIPERALGWTGVPQRGRV